MFHPLSAYIGLRYARARSHRFFVSFITWVSLAGVAVGVAALIVILSVMNGFESELRSRLLSLSSAVRVQDIGGGVAGRDQVRQIALQIPGVTGVSPHAELQVLAVRQPEMLPLLLRGADLEADLSLRRLMVDAPADPRQVSRGLVLGRLVAEQLGVVVGDAVTLLVPQLAAGGVPQARLREFEVTGVFEAGIQDHDGTLAFASLPVLAELGVDTAGSVGLDLQVGEPLAAPLVAQALRERLASEALERPALEKSVFAAAAVRDWTQDHASYFRAIRIEKTMMALILLLVVAVAAFNIVAMLVMVVTDKRTDIAILRTLGAGPARVAAAFVVQGLVVGWAGVLAGVALGVVLARNVGPVLAFLDRTIGLQLFDANVFYITDVPSELHATDVWLIACSALLVTALATVYPARRAAAVPPAEALRYE